MNRKNIKASPKLTHCIITDRGNLVLEKTLKAYEMPSFNSTTNALDNSKNFTAAGEVITPPFNLPQLMSWLTIDPTHAACIKAKKNDIVGAGYEINPTEEMSKEEILKDPNYKKIIDFFKNVNEKKQSLTKILKKIYTYYDGCGNSYIEVKRGITENQISLYAVDALTIYWLKDKKRFVQQVGNDKVYFKLFGNEDQISKITGEKYKENQMIKPEDLASELIPIVQDSWMSSCYGVPEWLPALYSMLANYKEMEYNIDFFINFGVPAYAVVINGAEVDVEMEETITKYFKTQVQGQNHKTMTLTAPPGGEIKFEKLSVDIKEASFRMYRSDNRDTILTSHHVPPYRVGLVISGQLGGTVAGDTDIIYMKSVIKPGQDDFADVINNFIIKNVLGIEGWEIKFNSNDISNEDLLSNIYSRYIQNGILTPNEVRRQKNLDPYEGGDLFYVTSGLTPVGSTIEGDIEGDNEETVETDAIQSNDSSQESSEEDTE